MESQKRLTMFNRRRIKDLEARVKWLEHCREGQRDKSWELERDLKVLADHLGLTFEDVEKQRIVVKKK